MPMRVASFDAMHYALEMLIVANARKPVELGVTPNGGEGSAKFVRSQSAYANGADRMPAAARMRRLDLRHRIERTAEAANFGVWIRGVDTLQRGRRRQWHRRYGFAMESAEFSSSRRARSTTRRIQDPRAIIRW